MDFSAMSVISAMVEVVIIGAIGAVFLRSMPRSRIGRTMAMAELGAFLLLVFFVDVSAYPSPQVLARNAGALKGLVGWFGLEEIQVGAAIIAVLLGCGAHWFKQFDQLWFGNFEVLFGVATAFQSGRAFTRDSSAIEVWIALGASAYIVARGLGNRRDAGSLDVIAKPATATG